MITSSNEFLHKYKALSREDQKLVDKFVKFFVDKQYFPNLVAAAVTDALKVTKFAKQTEDCRHA